ncbi:MAG: sensor domain-containing diguanylate cyclase [Azoarcus sp.]|jgi:diguanylate cyclase (GGDEF)-like protein|nr:sensor domain-containing diguanylate cyclase [Azoarcus sp.]
MDARRYSYDVGGVQVLFEKIIERLSAYELAKGAILHILVDVCQHFRFGCGFVYEADHEQTFILKERFAIYAASALPESFKLEKHLSVEQISTLLSSAGYFQDIDDREKKKLGSCAHLFKSSTVMLVPVTDDDGGIVGLVGMMDRRRNVLTSEQARRAAKMVLNLLSNSVKLRIFQKRVEYAHGTLGNILDNMGVDIYVNDFATHEILYVNKSMAKPYGGLERMLGKKCWDALYSDKTGQCEYCPAKKIIDEDGNPTKIYSWDYQRPFDGSWFRVLSTAFRWTDGRLAHIVSSVDITENKKNEAIIARMANYDALTNLPNRRKLFIDYKEAERLAEGNESRAYLLFFDLDNFKKLNDSMGHMVGDELLTQISIVLTQNPLTSNHIYRLGGDEFVLLYQNAGREHVQRVVDFLLGRFVQPWQLKDVSPVCRVSIGIASSPDDGRALDDLLRNADLMMYKAKQHGRGIACFTDGEIVRLKK